MTKILSYLSNFSLRTVIFGNLEKKKATEIIVNEGILSN